MAAIFYIFVLTDGITFFIMNRIYQYIIIVPYALNIFDKQAEMQLSKLSQVSSHVLSCSGSSFLSSCSSFSGTSSHEQILESFLSFIRASDDILADLGVVATEVARLVALAGDMLNNDSTDLSTSAPLEGIYDIFKDFCVHKRLQSKSAATEEGNETCSTVEKQSVGEMVRLISKIVFHLFTAENKEKYTRIVLGLQQNGQRVFMELIEKQMLKDQAKESKIDQWSQDQELVQGQKSEQGNKQSQVQGQNQCKKDSSTLDGPSSKQQKTLEKNKLNLPPAELVQRILNLEEYLQILNEEMQRTLTLSQKYQLQNAHLQAKNLKLSQQKNELNIRICELKARLEELASSHVAQINKMEKKWQGRVKVLQKNSQEQIQQLIEINHSTVKKNELKISQYEQRLSKKRAKIESLYENQLKLQESLTVEQSQNRAHQQQIAYLNEQLGKARDQIHQYEMLKDSLSLQIDVRNNRLEDMRMLLLAGSTKMGIVLQATPMDGEKENKCGLECSCQGRCQDLLLHSLDWSVGTNQWRDSTHASKFRKLSINHLNQHYVSQIGAGTGYSWFKQSFSAQPDKLAVDLAVLSHADFNRHYEVHVRYLNQKILTLSQENEKYRKSYKKQQELRYQNKRLVQALKQHQVYRGEENEIISGCLYELRKLHQSNLMEMRSLDSAPEQVYTGFTGKSQAKQREDGANLMEESSNSSSWCNK